MKLKYIVGLGVILVTAAAAVVVGHKTNFVPTKSVHSVAAPQLAVKVTPPPTVPASTESTVSPATSAPTTTPPVTTQTPAVKTVDQLKAEAQTTIGNTNQYDCFDRIIQLRYNWNITETEMLHRIQTVGAAYVSYCAAYGTVSTYPLSAPTPPPGFRD
jgi:hypothetical protein